MEIKRSIRLLIACVICFGCVDAKRESYTLDPITMPFLLPVQTPTFEWETGHVKLQWQYIGRPVQKFKVLRHAFRPGGTIDLGWIDAPVVVDDPFSTRSDIQPIQTFIDTTSLYAGERFAYTIEAVDAVAGVRQAFGDVIIPGAAIEDVELSIDRSSALISWKKSDDRVVAYDVVRQVDGDAPEVIFRTSDISVLQFEDLALEGNRLHEYSVLSHLDNGMIRKGIAIKRAVYFNDGQWTGATSDVFLLTDGVSLASALLSFTVRGGQLVLERRDLLGDVIEHKVVSDWTPEKYNMASFSFALTSTVQAAVSGRTILPRVLIAAVEIATSQVSLQVWDWEQEEILADLSSTWPIPLSSSKTYISVDDMGYVWVMAGQKVRVFDPELQFVREFDSSFQSSVTGFVMGGNALWVLLKEEKRLLRSQDIVHERLLDIVMQWQDVDLPHSARPVSLGVDPENSILVLDEGLPQILVYTFNGIPSVPWKDIEGIDVLSGSVRFMSALDYVFIWDQTGVVKRYKKFLILGANQ